MDWQLSDICKTITNNMLVRSVPLDTQCRAPRKHFSWTSPGPMAFENEKALIFFQTAPKKIHLTNSPHIKILLVNKL